MSNQRERPTVRMVVSGPVQVGKSIVLARLKQVLEEEFGCTVASDQEVSQLSAQVLPQSLADWEKAMVKKNLWVLTEGNEADSALNLRATFAQGFTTCESFGTDFKVVTKFPTLATAQAAHQALVNAVAVNPAGFKE